MHSAICAQPTEKEQNSMAFVSQPRNKPEHYDRTTPIELPICEPLLVRLTDDIGILPAGSLIYSLPRFEAEKLIMRRLATAVGTLGVMADLTLTEDEFAEAGI
jgi:hypothetical protein